MNNLPQFLEELKREMLISPKSVWDIARDFQTEMLEGLAGRPSSLKMLPSQLNNPNGQEMGTFLALDFGGTNVRVLLVELAGDGVFQIRKNSSFLLKNEKQSYDYTSGSTKAEELFDFIASKIAELIESRQTYYLGHTFSFPFRLEGINQGFLINWTKEFKTAGVEGENVSRLLQEALKRQKLNNVIPIAILNDTVGTQLAGAYGDNNCRLASILGTGHNSCYLEDKIIINLESGNFSRLPRTKYDRQLDELSESPGSQLLEKMVSGRYLGELIRLIILQLIEEGLLFGKSYGLFKKSNSLTGAEVSLILVDRTANLSTIKNLLEENFSLLGSSYLERAALQEISNLLMVRSACLAAATYLGVLEHIDSKLEKRHTIAIDGSLFEKMPGYAQTLEKTLQRALGENAEKISLLLTKDGSGIGAAIAAAVNVQKNR